MCYGQVTAVNACVFADCNSVMQQMAAVAGDVTRGWSSEQLCWLVGWLVDIFCLDHSWTPMPNAVLLTLQIFKQTQKLTFFCK